MTHDDDHLRYPIGRFDARDVLTLEERAIAIEHIASLPRELADAVAGLNDEQLGTPYRPGGWTVNQVVHHVADSHMNAFIRFKLALTEEKPTVKPYDEGSWADQADYRMTPLAVSLSLVDALHARWTILLRSMSEPEFARTFHHPEHGRDFSLDRTLGMYAWHGRHHVAHITALRGRENW